MANVKTKRKFGCELEALLSIAQEETAPSQNLASLQWLSVNALHISPYQPRKSFNEDALKELADSIKAQGILQPIVVRAKGNDYEIIAGERRFRAAKLAGLMQVPVVIHDVPDHTALAFALIENIQREDLNPLEEAQALHRLLTEFSMTHEAVAQAVGRSRVAVTNLLRLLNLCEEVKALLLSNEIDMGHARALVPLSKEMQMAIAELIIVRNLSVREAESLIKKQSSGLFESDNKFKEHTVKFSPQIVQWVSDLNAVLLSKADIKINQKGRGKIVLSFESIKDLEDMIKKICVQTE